MRVQTTLLGLLGLLAGASLTYGAWAILRAQRDLVTLNVRNMEVRQAVKRIERQTWETILVHGNVQGKVTLHVHQVPLEEVLRIIGDQTSSSWGMIYPLYSKGRSLSALKQALRGEVDPATGGWSNLQSRFLVRGGPGGMMGGGPPSGGARENAKPLVSLQLENKDVSFATLALNRFAQARVVPEDGTTANVSLTLKQATVPRAVAQLAKKAHRNWTKLYTLRGELGRGGPGGPGGPGAPLQFASRDPSSPAGFGGPGGPPASAADDPNRSDRRGPGGPDLTPEQREEFRKQREQVEEELKQTLPVAERERIEQAQQQREQQMQEMQSLTPEQRRARLGQMGGGGMDRRNLERIKNTTPEQRAEQYRRMAQMRQRFQQQPPQGPPQPPPR